MNHSSLDISGLSLALYRSRVDLPAVLFCHSNSASSELFLPLFDSPLGRDFQLLALDFPGHGKSSRSKHPERDYSIPGLAALVRQVVDALELKQCVLVGHSLGGHVLLEALPELPCANALMLISAPPCRATELGSMMKPDPTDGAMFTAHLSADQEVAFSRAITGAGQHASAPLALVRRTIRATDPSFREHLGRSIAAGKLADEVAIAKETSVPVSLVYGGRDPFLQRDFCDGTSLNRPWGPGLYPLEQAGHSPHLESPSEFFPLLEAFVRAHLNE